MTELVYDRRLYKYIKMTAIPNEMVAFVEYIKNSYDAYIRKHAEGNDGKIFISLTANLSKRNISVLDRATGMSSAELISNFSQVGSHTGGDFDNVNALFSKGATDTTALGDVTYVSIKNNKISSCKITHYDLFYTLISDRNVTEKERELYSIPENGTLVTLNFLDSYNMHDYDKIMNTKKYFSLANILLDPKINIVMTFIDIYDNVLDDQSDFSIEPIPIEKVLIDNEQILIPDWKTDEGGPVYSHFSIYLAKNDIDEINTHSHYKRNGVNVEYNGIIIDSTLFHRSIETYPISKKIFGVLRCDFLFTLMKRYDQGDTDPNNLLPLIEPNRLTGLNTNHKFISDLFFVPREHTKFIIEDLDKKMNTMNEQNSLQIDNLFSLLGSWHSAILYEMRDLLYKFKKTKTISNYNTVIKVSERVEMTSKESEYNFSDSNEIENSEEGNIDTKFPNLVITFIYDQEGQYPYVIYSVNNRIQIDINAADFMITESLQYKKDEKGKESFTIIDKDMLGTILTVRISEALLKEIFRYKQDKLSILERSENTMDDTFSELFKIRPAMEMAVYTILVKQNKIKEIVENHI